MEAFCFIGLIICAVVIIGCTTALERKHNWLEEREDKDFNLLYSRYKDLYNDQKALEYRIQKLETAINKNRNQKRK